MPYCLYYLGEGLSEKHHRHRVWAKIWSVGDKKSPWLKFWGTFLFLGGGGDKLIVIQHFYIYIHTGKPTKTFFLPEKWYKQEKLSYWCQGFSFLVIFKQRINDHALYLKTFHSRISSRQPLWTSIPFLIITGRRTCTNYLGAAQIE